MFDPPPTGLIPILESSAHIHDPKKSPEAYNKRKQEIYCIVFKLINIVIVVIEDEAKELKKLDDVLNKLEAEIASLTK